MADFLKNDDYRYNLFHSIFSGLYEITNSLELKYYYSKEVNELEDKVKSLLMDINNLTSRYLISKTDNQSIKQFKESSSSNWSTTYNNFESWKNQVDNS